MPQKSGGYAEHFRREKLGKTPHDPGVDLRRGADTLPGRDFTGSIAPTPMAGLNPTNADAFGLSTILAGNAMPWNDPSWMAPAWYGHNVSLQDDMALRVAKMVAARHAADQSSISNVAAGSVAPIYYPSPTAAPNRPESQQMGYAQQDNRVHGAPGSAKRKGA